LTFSGFSKLPTVVVGTVLDLQSAAARWDAEGVRVVAIDGVDGSGKSYLRAQLAACIEGSTEVDLDDHLVRNQKKFVGALRLDDLAANLPRQGFVLISGVCMRDVLQRIGLSADVHIYVKRMARWGWADEDEVEGPATVALTEAAGIAGRASALAAEVIAYHQRFRPQDCADIIYERQEAT
jgi:hypothetical protein